MENNQNKNIRDWLRRWGGTCAAGIALLVLILAVGWHWCSIWAYICPIWLDFGVNTGDRARNLALTFAAPLALVGILMAYWRNRTADKQTETAIKQANTSERGLQNDRYQKGSEMLGSGVLVVRMGGVVALERLASDQPVEYHIQIMNLLCAFIRHPSEDASHVGASAATNKDDGDGPKCRPDVELAAQVLGRRSEAQCKIERKNEWRADLRRANLIGANLYDANLVGADLQSAKLIDADMYGTNLSGANLSDADLTKADLAFADLTKACLFRANLTDTTPVHANLTDANLTKANLTNAIISEAIMTEANLTEANLTKATLGAVKLIGADLQSANLHSANLIGANLSDANLTKANLTETNLANASLHGATIEGANLTDAYFNKANLTGAILRNVQGLTQKQLNSAKASKDSPPFLTNSVCALTQKQLVWGAQPIKT